MDTKYIPGEKEAVIYEFWEKRISETASRGMIEARRKAGVSTHPFYWGAFVAAGQFR